LERLSKGHEMDLTRKYIPYYRVSTYRQGQSGLGLEAQRSAVANYLTGDWSFVQEFTEIESGRNDGRPQLALALAAARLHRCPVVVAKVDRLTRSVPFLSRLLEAGVDVMFADLPDIKGPIGRFLLLQMVAVAELEAGFISGRTKAALAQSKKQLGGPRRHVLIDEHGNKTYGDIVVAPPSALVAARAAIEDRVSKRAADLAPTIRELHANGATTLRAIAVALNGMRLSTARGGQWDATQVRRLLART
jgi:DNA invertase Pin-like site-specific DNA recombinase